MCFINYMEVIAVKFDEKVVATGISQGRLMLFIIELCGEDYICKKAVNFGGIDKFAIHSIINFENSVYLADSFNNKIYKYDYALNEFYETTVGRDPRHMAIANDTMYVANFESDNISVIDMNSFTLTGSIPAGIKTHDVVLKESNKMLYTSCYEENEVIEYSIESENKRIFKTDGKPMHLRLSNNSIIVMTYFVNGNIHTKINFIDTITGNVGKVIEIEGLASDFDFDNEQNMLYIINIVDKSLYVVDIMKKEIVKKIYIGGYPESLSIGEKNIYVTNSKKCQIASIEKEGFYISKIINLQFVPDCIKVI